MSKTVKSIRIKNDSWANVCILGISMTGRMASTSGIDNVEAEGVNGAEIEAVYNLQGVRLEAPVKGINIIRYTDGTTRKVIVL